MTTSCTAWATVFGIQNICNEVNKPIGRQTKGEAGTTFVPLENEKIDMAILEARKDAGERRTSDTFQTSKDCGGARAKKVDEVSNSID